MKAKLIEKLKALEKKYKELEKENDILKLEKVENINTIEKLKKRVTELEKLATVEKDVEELDLSFGPRYCKKCGHETEDGYQLDAHHWSEHDDGDDPIFFNCQQCVERFSTLKDLMVHKKNKHSDIVNVCWHYSNGFCPFRENCWFKHENKESKNKSNTQTMKCNICEKILMGKKVT